MKTFTQTFWVINTEKSKILTRDKFGSMELTHKDGYTNEEVVHFLWKIEKIKQSEK